VIEKWTLTASLAGGNPLIWCTFLPVVFPELILRVYFWSLVFQFSICTGGVVSW
jgi:hypothetical protein